MTRLRPLLAHLYPASIASVVIGIILVMISELGDVHELRIFGAILLSSGGLGIGTHTGLADPRKITVPSWLHDWRAVLGVLAGLLAILPVLVVLAMAVGGIFGDSGDRSGLMLALGALLILAMGAAVVVTGTISLRAILQAAREHPAEQGASAAEVAEASKEG